VQSVHVFAHFRKGVSSVYHRKSRLDVCAYLMYDRRMHRLNVNLSERQMKVLTKHANKAGISVAEFIRRILDDIFFPAPPLRAYIARLESEKERAE